MDRIAANKERLRKLGLDKTVGQLAKEEKKNASDLKKKERMSWTVEKFVGHRIAAKKKGYWELLTRWVGYDSTGDTWEPINQKNKEFPSLVEAYIKQNPEVGKMPETARSTRSNAKSRTTTKADARIGHAEATSKVNGKKEIGEVKEYIEQNQEDKTPKTARSTRNNSNSRTTTDEDDTQIGNVELENKVQGKKEIGEVQECIELNPPVAGKVPEPARSTRSNTNSRTTKKRTDTQIENNEVETTVEGKEETDEVSMLATNGETGVKTSANMASNDKTTDEKSTQTGPNVTVMRTTVSCRFNHDAQETYKEETNPGYAKPPYYLSGKVCAGCKALFDHKIKTHRTELEGQIFVKPMAKHPVWACSGTTDGSCSHVLCSICFRKNFLMRDSDRKHTKKSNV